MFKCQRREGEFYEMNYVRQIVNGLAERKRREQELIQIIQAKDKELDDYRSQGTCQLQRAWLATQPFNKDEFDKATLSLRHDDTSQRTLDLVFDCEGQELIQQCFLRNEYRKRLCSTQVADGTSTKNHSTQNRTPMKRTMTSSRVLNDDELAAEKRRHDELQERLRLEKEREEQIAKKKKKKFV
jgi:hypothetical protein